MNERIKELILQSVTFRLDPDSECYEALVCPEDLEHLAELIVKQCRDIVADTRNIAIEDGWNVDEAMSTAMYDIEEYFGVEL